MKLARLSLKPTKIAGLKKEAFESGYKFTIYQRLLRTPWNY